MKFESSTGRAPSRIAIAASIAILVVVLAINFIAAKIGLLYLPPLAMASFRVVLAGTVMVPLYLFGSRLPAFAEPPIFVEGGSQHGTCGPSCNLAFSA